MRKRKESMLILAVMVALMATVLFLPGRIVAGNLEPPALPDNPESAMYTIEDLYNYLNTGVADTKRSVGFTEPTSPPGSTGYTLDDVYAKIGERCITCEGTLSAEGRWCDNGDGTVKDMTTGLVWLKNADCMGYMTWSEAIKMPIEYLMDGVCGLTDGSVWGDWRLPTKDELYGIAQGTEYVSTSDMYFFNGVQFSYYWSSTTWENDSLNAWVVTLYLGFASYTDKESIVYVWPVRHDK